MCHDEVAPYGEGSREELIALQTRLVKSPFQLSDTLFEILDLVGRRFFSVNTSTRSGLPRDVFRWMVCVPFDELDSERASEQSADQALAGAAHAHHNETQRAVASFHDALLSAVTWSR